MESCCEINGFRVALWEHLGALGSIHREHKVHFSGQLRRNQWFDMAEGGSWSVQNVISADSCSEIIGFKGDLEDLWKHFGGASRSIHMEPKAHFGRQLQRN